MRKILPADRSHLQKYLQQWGYWLETEVMLGEVRTTIKEEMPLLICCDLDLPGRFWHRFSEQDASRRRDNSFSSDVLP